MTTRLGRLPIRLPSSPLRFGLRSPASPKPSPRKGPASSWAISTLRRNASLPYLRAAVMTLISVASTVSSNRDMAGLVAAAEKHFGRVDIMVNNAGISHANQPMLNVSEAEFDPHFQVNVKSLYLSAVALRPRFPAATPWLLYQYRIDRGGPPASRPHLVQRLQRRRRAHHQIDGHRTRPGQHPRPTSSIPRSPRNAPAFTVHGHQPTRPSIAAVLSVRSRSARLGRSSDVANAALLPRRSRLRVRDRRVPRSRWWPLHLAPFCLLMKVIKEGGHRLFETDPETARYVRRFTRRSAASRL